MTVEPIGIQGVTPRFLLEKVAESAEDIEEIYVMVFTKKGRAIHSYCGNARGLALSGAMMTQDALEALHNLNNP